MPGSSQLTITGQLGDVMKESARIALSWFRAHASKYGVDPTFYRTRNCTSTCRPVRFRRTVRQRA